MKNNFTELQEAIENVDVEQQEEKAPVSKDWRHLLHEKLEPLVTFKTTLIGSGETIEYKSMSTKDLKRLLMFQGVQNPAVIEDIFDKLINSVVVTEGFSVDNLYAFDRMYLLVQIRMNSKGGLLESSYKCSNCGNQALFTHHLADFDFIPKPENVNKEIVVSDGFSLLLDYNTRRDQKQTFQFLKAKNEDEMVTELSLLNLAALIKGVKINGTVVTGAEFTAEDKINTFMDLPESILDKIIAWDKDNQFGIKMAYERTCPHCDNTDTIEIPLSSLF